MFGLPKFGPDKNPEQQVEVEKPLETEIRLEIFRHSKRENDPNRPNSELLLTPEGRELAQEKGLQLNPDVNVSVAGASTMDRTAETAMLVMAANEEKISISDNLDEMDKKISEELKFGKKIYRDERLSFNTNGPLEEDHIAAFKSGKYMEWLVNDSDNQAIMKGDTISTTYLRQAGNIAEIIDKYSKIGNNFNRLAREKSRDNKEFADHLERYLVSHQGVLESFMAELIKIQEGKEAQVDFLKNLGNGWAETEGISVKIKNQDEERIVLLSYKDKGELKKLKLEPETIQKIIARRQTFEKAAETASRADKSIETSFRK
jgi:broad specificity phosphatase PhoE